MTYAGPTTKPVKTAVSRRARSWRSLYLQDGLDPSLDQI